MRPAHAALPISLDDPTVFAFREDQRRALCGRLELAPGQADDLSRWVLDHPGEFHAADLRCWRIGSATWLALAEQQLQPVQQVERPVGVFVVPAGRDGWQLIPVLSLDAIRLIYSSAAASTATSAPRPCPPAPPPSCSNGSTSTRCTPARRTAWTPPASSPTNSPGHSAPR